MCSAGGLVGDYLKYTDNEQDALDYALCIEAEQGNYSAVEHLLARGANPSADDNTPLKWAARNGHLLVVNLLAKSGATLNDDVAVRWACAKGQLHVVKVLTNGCLDLDPVSLLSTIPYILKAPGNNYRDALGAIRQAKEALTKVPSIDFCRVPDTALSLILAHLGGSMNNIRVSSLINNRICNVTKNNHYWLTRMEVDNNVRLNHEEFLQYDAREICKIHKRFAVPDNPPESYLIYLLRTSQWDIGRVVNTALRRGIFKVLRLLESEGYSFVDYINKITVLNFNDIRVLEFLLEQGVDAVHLLALVKASQRDLVISLDAAKFLIKKITNSDQDTTHAAIMFFTCDDEEPDYAASFHESIGPGDIGHILYSIQFYNEPGVLKGLIDHGRVKGWLLGGAVGINDAVLIHGHTEVLNVLLESGVMHYTSSAPGKCRHLSIIQTLHTWNLIDDASPLYDSAIEHNDLDIIEFLIDKGYISRTGIRQAISHKRTEAMALILKQYVDDIDTINRAFAFACESGTVQQVKILIDAGAAITLANVIEAITNRNYDAAELLVQIVPLRTEILTSAVKSSSSKVLSAVLRHGTWDEEEIRSHVDTLIQQRGPDCLLIELVDMIRTIDSRDIELLKWACDVENLQIVRRLTTEFQFSEKDLSEALRECVEDLSCMYKKTYDFVYHDIIDVIEVILEALVR